MKLSETFPASGTGARGDIIAFLRDQMVMNVATITDVRITDLELQAVIFVTGLNLHYRLDETSGADDDGDAVIHDSESRRYLKIT